MTRRRPRRPANANLRNGLVWRAGRPRWEPSPASRRAGLKGLDLKRADGTWCERGEAIGAADARALWARAIRDAAAGDAPALADLREAVDALPPPADAAARQRREWVADLIDAARAVLGEAGAGAPRAAARTVERLADAYFADAALPIAPATRRAYLGHSKRFKARFGPLRADAVTRGQLLAWHADLRAGGLGHSNANLAVATAAAIFAWGARADPPWLAASPATKLRLTAAPGRRVFWTLDEEQGFTAWCDAHQAEDVADGVIAALWTGARLGDLCAASLADLSGKVWRFVPAKTARKRQEAMPAVMTPVAARVARRRHAALAALDGAFLFDPRTARRHTPGSFYRRFLAAQAGWIAAGAPAGFAAKRVQDCRDTCITRLWEAGVAPATMYAWTGHNRASVEEILREHYVVLREQGSLAMADKLGDWARKEGMAL